jgi:hypothetical protein
VPEDQGAFLGFVRAHAMQLQEERRQNEQAREADVPLHVRRQRDVLADCVAVERMHERAHRHRYGRAQRRVQGQPDAL